MGTDQWVEGVEKIAVLRANALGDYVMTVPALTALRAAYPAAEIVLLGAAWHREYLPGRPGPVDRVEVVPPVSGVTAPAGAPGDAAEFQYRMRAERFDVALQMHGGGRYSNPFTAALGARVTAGLRAPDAPALGRCVPYEHYQSEVFRFLEVAGLVGAVPGDVEPHLAVTDADLAEVAAVLPEELDDVVVLHPGATDPRRRWPANRFAEVGDALAAEGAAVVVTGTANESGLVAEVVARMCHAARPLVGALSVGGLGALCARSRVVVSNDTGPLHVAAAVGAATVGIYWCGNLINAGPFTRTRHRPQISWTIHCPVCGVDCTLNAYPARAGGAGCRHRASFVADVPVAEVRSAALDLLRRAPERLTHPVL